MSTFLILMITAVLAVLAVLSVLAAYILFRKSPMMHEKGYGIAVAAVTSMIIFLLILQGTDIPRNLSMRLVHPDGSVGANITLYDGAFEVQPGVATAYPSEREINVSIEAPRSVYVRHTYGITVEVSQRGAITPRTLQDDRFRARLLTPSYITTRPAGKCSDGEAEKWISCPVEEGRLAVRFRWDLDADNTAPLAKHSIFIPDLLYVRDATLGVVREQIGEGLTTNNEDVNTLSPMFGIGRLQPPIGKASGFVLMVRSGDESQNVRNEFLAQLSGNVEVNLLDSSIILPIEVVTDLGVDQRSYVWFSLFGSIGSALLGGGLGGWLIGRLSRTSDASTTGVRARASRTRSTRRPSRRVR